jgi:hypothetical protein
MLDFSIRIKKFKSKKEEIINKYENTSSEDNPKEALIEVNKKMNNGTNNLTNSIKVMRGVNERDNNTMSTLVVQTNTIISAKDTLNNMETIVSRSDKVVRGLLRRLQSNKLMLYFIAILLLLTIIMVLYIKIKRGLGI